MQLVFCHSVEASESQESHCEIQKCGNWQFVRRVAQGGVAALFGHGKDGVVIEQLHGGLHVTPVRLNTPQSLNVQGVRCEDKTLVLNVTSFR